MVYFMVVALTVSPNILLVTEKVNYARHLFPYPTSSFHFSYPTLLYSLTCLARYGDPRERVLAVLRIFMGSRMPFSSIRLKAERV